VAVVGLLSACAGTAKPLPRLAADLRSSLGSVGVITSGPPVGGKVQGPVGIPGQVALGVVTGGAVGTVGGAGVGFLASSVFCGPVVLICGAILVLGGAAAGLVSGGAYGGISQAQDAIPGSTAEQIQTALTRAISEDDLQADLRMRVLQHFAGGVIGADLGADAVVPVGTPDYSAFASGGTATVLEMSLTQLIFTGEGGRNPSLRLVVTARARLIRIADNRVLWDAKEVRYESAAAEFSLWTARDSGLLEGEIDNGLEALARQMGDALFFPTGNATGLVSVPRIARM
jgi:hypothetical protein